MLGHSKTVLVLLGGWLFLGDALSQRKLLGMTLAVAGMVWYGKASMMAAAPKRALLHEPGDPAAASPRLTNGGVLDGQVQVSLAGAHKAREAV